MSKPIVILTGAGISAESGIRTFRGGDGLWENHRVEDVATPEGFAHNPALVHRFYNARRRQIVTEAQPNAAHRAIADFQAHYPGEVTLVTQNIDDLHERGGSSEVLHMHGEVLKSRCIDTGLLHPTQTDINTQTKCPCCHVAGNLRPHIVWFGEMPLFMEAIDNALSQCGVFISIGTSGNVYPAAGFYQTAKYYGAHTVELNLEASLNGSQFAEQHYGPATQVVGRYLATLLDV